MYPEEVYEDLRKSNPWSLDIAEKIYRSVLVMNHILVRGYVWRTPSNRMAQFAEIEVIDLAYFGSPKGQETEYVLSALKFRTESDMQQNEIGLVGTALYIDGPTWNDVPIQIGDVINQLATHVTDWSRFKSEWLESTDAFVGCYVLSNDVSTRVPASHPLILPFISMCFGAFRASYSEHLDMVMRTAGTGLNADARKKALMSFSKRFGSFVAQAQRESARNYFGSFFASSQSS